MISVRALSGEHPVDELLLLDGDFLLAKRDHGNSFFDRSSLKSFPLTGSPKRAIYLPYNRFTKPLSSISFMIDASMKSLGLSPLA